MPANLIRHVNVVNVPLVIDLAWIAVGHHVAFASVDYKFESLSTPNNNIRLKTPEKRIVNTGNRHLPGLLGRKLAHNLDLRLRRKLHLLLAVHPHVEELVLEVDCGFEEANPSKKFQPHLVIPLPKESRNFDLRMPSGSPNSLFESLVLKMFVHFFQYFQ